MTTISTIQQRSESRSQRRGWLRIHSGVVIAGMLCLSPPACLATGQGDRPVVSTASGKVEGIKIKNGVLAFLGIPFAQPPKGDLRFAPPVEVAPWEGVRDATHSAPMAPQPVDASDPEADFTQDEACLNLDIWTPGADGRKRPVLVFIHGGTFMFDASSNPVYDGANISRRGDIVFASINYRLGMLGFLCLDDFGVEYQGSGSNGIRDQILALRWLKKNIARFGGDPENITIMGESAGAMSVITLMGLPQTKGLFQKAIAESGPMSLVKTKEEAASFTADFMEICKKKYGVTDVVGLRKLTPKEILDAQSELFAAKGGMICPRMCVPFVDGTVIPKEPVEAIRDGAAAGIALLNGSNHDEYTMWIQFKPDLQSEPLSQFLSETPWFARNLGDRRQKVLDFYDKRNPTPVPDKSGISSAVAYVTDDLFLMSHIKISEAQAKHAKVWMYRFDWKSQAQAYVNACHGLELPFVFNTFAPDLTDGFVGTNPPRGLSGAMQDAWISFARTGDPNHKGLPDWLAYEPAHRATMIFDTKSQVVEDPDPEVRQLFKDIPL